MSRRIVIAGAGGFGRGVYSWLVQSPKHRETFDVREIVYIDDNVPKVKPRARVISSIRDYIPIEGDQVLVAVGSPKIRRDIVEDLADRGARFHTFVDDRTVIAGGLEVGLGSIICPGTVISDRVSIGSHVHINFNCAIGHDTVLGKFTTLSPMTNIMGGVELGAGVFVGGSAVVLPRIDISNGVTIGAGATVTEPVNQDFTVVGNPAKRLNRTAN